MAANPARYRAVDGAERAAAHLRVIACGPGGWCFRTPHLLHALQRRRCRPIVGGGAGRLRSMPQTPAYRLDTTRGDGALLVFIDAGRRDRRARTPCVDRVAGATHPRRRAMWVATRSSWYCRCSPCWPLSRWPGGGGGGGGGG